MIFIIYHFYEYKLPNKNLLQTKKYKYFMAIIYQFLYVHINFVFLKYIDEQFVSI